MAPSRNSPCEKLTESPFFEMQKSSYLFTEATSLLIFFISLFISWHFASSYGILVTFVIFYCLGHAIWFILLLIFMPKLTKPPSTTWFSPTHKVPDFIEKTVLTPDGCNLRYYLSEQLDNKDTLHNGKKIICLAPPLGQCGHLVYDPLIAQLGTDEYIYLTWDYRGFFGSHNEYKYSPRRHTKPCALLHTLQSHTTHTKIRDISIHEFAMDIHQILQAEGIECVDHMIGHSMGCSVTMEFVVCFPHKINSMILLNGSHGTVFSTAFQPVLRMPFIGDLVAEFVSFMLNHPYLMDHVRYYVLQPSIKSYLQIYVKIFGSPLLQDMLGKNYLFEFFQQYLDGICDDSVSLHHYFRAFQELHSHSVYHLLDKIHHPTLIISGLWDVLLPCLSSFEMARKLPNAKHCCDVYSSHATILENPESCVYEIVSFIKNMQGRKNKMA